MPGGGGGGIGGVPVGAGGNGGGGGGPRESGMYMPQQQQTAQGGGGGPGARSAIQDGMAYPAGDILSIVGNKGDFFFVFLSQTQKRILFHS